MASSRDFKIVDSLIDARTSLESAVTELGTARAFASAQEEKTRSRS